MLNKLNTLIQRLERQVVSKENACQKVQREAEAVREEIAAQQQRRTRMQQHLSTLMLTGETSLTALLDNKARQGTIQRKLAEITLLLADKQQQQEQLAHQQDRLRAERHQLQKKVEKMAEHLRRWRQLQQQGIQRRQESETEEQLNWQR